MPQQPPIRKNPPLLEEPDRRLNLLRAATMISEVWEMMPGGPITENALKSWALSLLEIAEDWPKAELLVNIVRTGCQRRPVPIEMRRFYCEQIGDPADGISDSWADLSEFMGGSSKRRSTGE